MEERCLLVDPQPASSRHRSTCPGVAGITGGCTLPHSSPIEKPSHRHALRPVWGRQHFNWGLGEVDKINIPFEIAFHLEMLNSFTFLGLFKYFNCSFYFWGTQIFKVNLKDHLQKLSWLDSELSDGYFKIVWNGVISQALVHNVINL